MAISIFPSDDDITNKRRLCVECPTGTDSDGLRFGMMLFVLALVHVDVKRTAWK